MFNHILVPVDGSNTAQVAVGKAIELAKAFGSTVTVIYVIDPYPFTGVGTDFAYGQAEYLSAATAEANADRDRLTWPQRARKTGAWQCGSGSFVSHKTACIGGSQLS